MIKDVQKDFMLGNRKLAFPCQMKSFWTKKKNVEPALFGLGFFLIHFSFDVFNLLFYIAHFFFYKAE